MNTEVTHLVDGIAYQDGTVVSKTILKKKAGNITVFAFDKDQELSEHTAAFDALVYLLDGEAEIQIAGNPNILRAGDSILLPANVPHAVVASKKFKMMLVMIKS